MPATDDENWRALSLPHDFVVEGNFSKDAVMSSGYLPYGVGWYRRHFALASSLEGSVFYLDLEGVQTSSMVYLNGALLGLWGYGYTPQRYFLGPGQLLFGGADNVLAIQVDGE